MKKSMLFLTLLLVCLPFIGAEAARTLPLDLYPSNEDFAGRWFLFPQVKAVLLTIIILGILTEVKTAGAGIAGGVAIVAAAALFGMNFVSGAGSWLEVVLFIVGMGLLVLEIFIPGFGIFGIAGILSILASFYYVLGGNAAALNWLAVSIVAALAIFALIIKYLPSNPAWNLFVLKNKQENSKGYSGTPDMSDCSGKSGTAVTMLRPAGIALIDGVRIDVVTFGEYIDVGTKIIVVKVEGNKVFVRSKQEQ
ncbi:MAG: NfeD family protein [Acidaminococcaceae bacterium]